MHTIFVNKDSKEDTKASIPNMKQKALENQKPPEIL